MTIEQEGPHVRVVAGGRSYLLCDVQCETIVAAYERFGLEARTLFGARWSGISGPNITAEELELIVQRTVFDAIFFYTAHRLPIEIKSADFDHPQARRTVQEVVGQRWKGDAAVLLCAELTGLSKQEFEAWKRGDELYQNR